MTGIDSEIFISFWKIIDAHFKAIYIVIKKFINSTKTIVELEIVLMYKYILICNISSIVLKR